MVGYPVMINVPDLRMKEMIESNVNNMNIAGDILQQYCKSRIGFNVTSAAQADMAAYEDNRPSPFKQQLLDFCETLDDGCDGIVLKKYIENLSAEVELDGMVLVQDKMKINCIKELCQVLGLRYTFDLAATVGDAELVAFGEWYNTRTDTKLINKMFAIRCSGKGFKIQQSLTVINGILASWSGVRLVVVSSAHDVAGKRKLPNKDYVCKIEPINKKVVERYIRMFGEVYCV